MDVYMIEKKETKFAPAERATYETLQAQQADFTDAGFMLEIIDAVPNGVVVLNKQRQIVYSNNAFCQAVLGDFHRLKKFFQENLTGMDWFKVSTIHIGH